MMPNEDTVGRWPRVIASVTTPLGFLVLVVLVVATSLTAYAVGKVESTYFFSIIGLMVFLILVVAIIAVKWPEALKGERRESITTELARNLAIEVYSVVDGYFDDNDKEEAYTMLHDACLSRSDSANEQSREFVQTFVKTISERAALMGSATPRGHLVTPP